MAVVASTAMVLALYRPILFLALVAVFSFYAAFSAYRVLFHKNLPQGRKGDLARLGRRDLYLRIQLCPGVVGTVVKPVLVRNLAIPAIVFGIIGMWLAGKSMWQFLHPPKEKMFWWYEHLGNMLASYIAAWTAFSVVTIGRFRPWRLGDLGAADSDRSSGNLP